MTSPVGSLSSVTFTDEVTVTSERLPLPALREKTQELIGPSCEMTASKLKYFNSGRKLRRWKRVAHIASPQMPQTRRPGKYCVYRSHKRLYLDFSWDSVAQKNSFAFGANAPLVTRKLTLERSNSTTWGKVNKTHLSFGSSYFSAGMGLFCRCCACRSFSWIPRTKIKKN